MLEVHLWSFHKIKYIVFLLLDYPMLWSKTKDDIFFKYLLIIIRETWSYIYQIRLAY